MLREVERVLELKPGLIVVDGTVGAGGHSKMIAEKIKIEGKLVGLDRDKMMLDLASQVLGQMSQVILRQRSYAELPQVLEELKVDHADRVLLDLGLSSDQLADGSRGFGFSAEGPLDLRFDVSRGLPASEYLNEVTQQELSRILQDYGEIPQSERLAEFLSKHASRTAIETGIELAQVIELYVNSGNRMESRDKHPATRVFQALRIAVNHELDHVERGVKEVLHQVLKSGGIAAVISFHSLEDRMVKEEFRRSDRWENLTPKPIVASYQEQKFNPRSRSAKLRAARKV